MTGKLEQRIRRLEGPDGGDEPLEFTLVFVSTDGTPDRKCRYVAGALVEIEDEAEVSDGYVD